MIETIIFAIIVGGMWWYNLNEIKKLEARFETSLKDLKFRILQEENRSLTRSNLVQDRIGRDFESIKDEQDAFIHKLNFKVGGLETYQTDLNKRFELMCKDVIKLQSKKKK